MVNTTLEEGLGREAHVLPLELGWRALPIYGWRLFGFGLTVLFSLVFYLIALVVAQLGYAARPKLTILCVLGCLGLITVAGYTMGGGNQYLERCSSL
jgi:hypothetical protein